jgi:hypothetical protein
VQAKGTPRAVAAAGPVASLIDVDAAMIKVKCPNASCGITSVVKDEYAGKRAKCPACGTIMSIPNAPAEVPEAAVQAPPPARRAAPPPPPPAPVPEVEEEYEAYEEEVPRRRVGKSGQVTAIAVVNFVFGGLSLLCGLLMLVGAGLVGAAGSAATNPRIQTQGLPPEVAEKIAKEFGKTQATAGTTVGMLTTLLMIIAVVYLLWGAGAITAGVGLLQRRNWGRLLAMVLAGVAGVLALVQLVLVFMGGGVQGLVGVALNAAYAAWVFTVLLKPNVAREFS